MVMLHNTTYINDSSGPAAIPKLPPNSSAWQKLVTMSKTSDTPPNAGWSAKNGSSGDGNQVTSLLAVGSWNTFDVTRSINKNSKNLDRKTSIVQSQEKEKPLQEARNHLDATWAQNKQFQAYPRYAW